MAAGSEERGTDEPAVDGPGTTTRDRHRDEAQYSSAVEYRASPLFASFLGVGIVHVSLVLLCGLQIPASRLWDRQRACTMPAHDRGCFSRDDSNARQRGGRMNYRYIRVENDGRDLVVYFTWRKLAEDHVMEGVARELFDASKLADTGRTMILDWSGVEFMASAFLGKLFTPNPPAPLSSTAAIRRTGRRAAP